MKTKNILRSIEGLSRLQEINRDEITGSIQLEPKLKELVNSKLMELIQLLK